MGQAASPKPREAKCHDPCSQHRDLQALFRGAAKLNVSSMAAGQRCGCRHLHVLAARPGFLLDPEGSAESSNLDDPMSPGGSHPELLILFHTPQQVGPLHRLAGSISPLRPLPICNFHSYVADFPGRPMSSGQPWLPAPRWLCKSCTSY